jgi:hypothetical protein
MIKTAVACWLLIGLFLVGFLFIPPSYNWLLWVPYVVILVLGIWWCNAMQARIRAEESGSDPRPLDSCQN